MQNTADLNEHFRLCLLHPLQVLGLMRGRGCGHTAQFQQPIGPGRSWGSRTRWWPAHWEGGIHKVISTLSVSWTPTTMAISDSTYSDMSHIKWSQMNLAYVWCVLSIHKCFVLTEIQCPKATQSHECPLNKIELCILTCIDQIVPNVNLCTYTTSVYTCKRGCNHV